jgi:hypothetical protein
VPPCSACLQGDRQPLPAQEEPPAAPSRAACRVASCLHPCCRERCPLAAGACACVPCRARALGPPSWRSRSHVLTGPASRASGSASPSSAGDQPHRGEAKAAGRWRKLGALRSSRGPDAARTHPQAVRVRRALQLLLPALLDTLRWGPRAADLPSGPRRPWPAPPPPAAAPPAWPLPRQTRPADLSAPPCPPPRPPAVLQFLLSPLLLWHSFMSTALANVLYGAALCLYHYLNFLGYSALPFLERTEVGRRAAPRAARCAARRAAPRPQPLRTSRAQGALLGCLLPGRRSPTCSPAPPPFRACRCSCGPSASSSS